MKKRNKKIVALLLAMTTVLSMSSPVFAADDENDHSGSDLCNDEFPSSEIGVYGNYVDSLDAKKILSVDVAWTSMNFKYAEQQQGTWQPDSHTYEGSKTEAGWVNDSATITVNNHSNMAVTASLSYTPGTVTTVTGDFGKKTMKLETAEETDKDNPPTDSTTFTVDGSLSEGDTDLGTITVTVEDSEKYFDGLDLSGKELSEWPALVSAYLDEHPGELTVKLGMDSIEYVGDSNGSVDSANMPAHVLNNAVYAYNGNSFDNKVALTLVDVKTIGNKAFMYAAGSFSSISVPNATSIGTQAFQGNQATTVYNFPKVTSIGSSAFDYCGAMESITFGEVITSVSSNSFGSSSDSDFFGKDCHSENVTITLNPEQENYYNGYTTTWGENGKFASYTWKNVVKG